MKYTTEHGLPYPDDGDLISNYLPMFNDAMDKVSKHTHDKELQRLKALGDRIVTVHQQLDILLVKKFPGMEAMRVTQEKDRGFRFPANRRFTPGKTAISVVDEQRCFIYYNPGTNYWMIAQVEPAVSEGEVGVTIPGREFTIVVYSTDPITNHTPPSVLPDSSTDDTATSAKAAAKKKPKSEQDGANNSNTARDDKDNLRDPVWVLGDSLTVGSQKYIEDNYKAAGKIVKVTAKTGLTADGGVDKLNDAPNNAKTWVVALGTNPMNPDDFKRACKKILNAAGGKLVYWINVINFDSPSKASQTNEVLRDLVKEFDNMRLVNFYAEAKDKRSSFAGDGVHMDANGYKWRAKFYGPRNPNG